MNTNKSKDQKDVKKQFSNIDFAEMSKKYAREDEPINSHQMDIYATPVYNYVDYDTVFSN